MRPQPRPGSRQSASFEHDGFRGAQVGVVQAAVEGFQVLAAVAVAADGGEQAADLGGAGDHAAVDGLGDGGGLPPDPVDRVGVQQPQLDGVADGVVEHGALAPLGGGRGGLAGQGAGAGVQGEPDGGGFFQRGDGQRRGGDPVQRGGGLIGRGEVAGAGVERPAEQRPAQHGGVGGAAPVPDQRDRHGGQRLGDRPAGDGGQVRPFEVGVGAGVLIPGDGACGCLLLGGDGQPGARYRTAGGRRRLSSGR